MVELDRRLRLANRAGGRDPGDQDSPVASEQGSRAEPTARRVAPERIEANPEAVKVEADGPAVASGLPTGEGDEQTEAGMVDQLPPVEELANRLSTEVRTALDELFRAKWSAVRRLRPEDLKS